MCMGLEKVLRNKNMLAIDMNAYTNISFGRIKEIFLVIWAINKALNDLAGKLVFVLPSYFSAHHFSITLGLLNG